MSADTTPSIVERLLERADASAESRPRTTADLREAASRITELEAALSQIAALDQHSGASLRDRAASEIARAALTTKEADRGPE